MRSIDPGGGNPRAAIQEIHRDGGRAHRRWNKRGHHDMRGEVRRLVPTLPPLSALLAWCYWTTMERVAVRWATDPQCAQGYFVVAFAAFALWARRERFPEQPLRGNWWGFPTLGLAVAIRSAGAHYSIEAIELASLIVYLVGSCLVLGGWAF